MVKEAVATMNDKLCSGLREAFYCVKRYTEYSEKISRITWITDMVIEKRKTLDNEHGDGNVISIERRDCPKHRESTERCRPRHVRTPCIWSSCVRKSLRASSRARKNPPSSCPET